MPETSRTSQATTRNTSSTPETISKRRVICSAGMTACTSVRFFMSATNTKRSAGDFRRTMIEV